MTATDPLSLAPKRSQFPIYLIGFGHGATHWIVQTFLILLPAITKDLGLSYFEAGLLVSILHISSFVANLGSGVIVDVTGRKVIEASAGNLKRLQTRILKTERQMNCRR